MLLLLIGIYGISAMSHSLEFQYINKDSFSHTDTCEMCFGYDCIEINESRCQYYREVDNILNGDEDEYKRRDDEINDEVDDILWDYVNKAAVTSYKDCIPFVSQYTNCYKGNICAGCEVCNCDIKGEWNCSTVEQCYADTSLNVDHRTLGLSIETLTEYRNLLLSRNKRSIDFEKENKKINPKNILKWFFIVDKFDTSEEINNDIINNSNKNNDIDFRLLKKRDIIPVTDNYINSSNIFNKTDQIQKLYKNVLNPLINLVNAKRKELNQLYSVQENLVIFLKPHINMTVLNNVTKTTSAENPSIYFLQFELPVEYDEDLRKHDPKILNNYSKKLKHDINEIIRDITVIQRYSNTYKLPRNLKVLVKAIKYYMSKENKVKDKMTVNLQRNFDMNENHNKVYPMDVVIKILEVLDKNISTYDPLDSLSRDTREILKRIIQQFHVEDYINTSFRNFDYDIIANNLNSIGVNWKNMTSKIDTNPISERLYSMKLLHLQISKDIVKIIKAMELIDLLKHRRMSVIDNIVGEDLISRIEINFNKLKDRVNEIIRLQTPRYQNINKTINKPFLMKDENKVVKKSFLQRIKKLLKTSKKGLRKLLHKAPKVEVNKRQGTENKNEDSKKRLSEYEETMQRQNNLNFLRNKRYANFHNFMNRVKNFFPSFLGGNKMKHADKKKNINIATKKKHRSGHSKTKKIATTTSTYTLNPKTDHST